MERGPKDPSSLTLRFSLSAERLVHSLQSKATSCASKATPWIVRPPKPSLQLQVPFPMQAARGYTVSFKAEHNTQVVKMVPSREHGGGRLHQGYGQDAQAISCASRRTSLLWPSWQLPRLGPRNAAAFSALISVPILGMAPHVGSSAQASGTSARSPQGKPVPPPWTLSFPLSVLLI